MATKHTSVPNPYSVTAFTRQVGFRTEHSRLGPAIRHASWSAPGFRDMNSDEIRAVIDAAFPGEGHRCCNCQRRTADAKLRANDAIACDDCAAWAGVA